MGSSSSPTEQTWILNLILDKKLLPVLTTHLDSPIISFFNLARTCKAFWTAVGQHHHLWQELYLDSDPLVTQEIK
jgi:hypothetical protein